MHGTFVPPPEVKTLRRCTNDWTLREHAVVVDHWPDVEQIMLILKHRSRAAIVTFAGKCNLRKRIHLWTEEQTQTLRKRVRDDVPRKEIAKELRLTVLQVTNRCRQLGLTYPRRRPPETGHRLMDAIRARAFELNMSMSEVDEVCRSGRIFRRWSPARKIAPRHLIRAVKALDGELCAEWRNVRD